MRYLDPKNDLTFKKVFGEHPHLLRSFLNAVLPLPEDRPIVELEYLPSKLVPQLPLEQKHTIVDVRCKDTDGRQFLVEMQMVWTESFFNRILFNASKAYVKQLEPGKKYHLLEPVYALSLVNEHFTPGTEGEFYHHYQIVNVTHTNRQIEGLEFVFVELPKFRPRSLTEKKLQVLWLRYLTEIHGQNPKIPQDLLEDTDVREAVEILAESAFTAAELESYDRYWDSVSIERTLVGDSLAAGEKVGIEKGEKRGLKKGEKIGIQKGRKEGEKIGIQKGEKIGLQKALERLVAGGMTQAEARKMLGI